MEHLLFIQWISEFFYRKHVKGPPNRKKTGDVENKQKVWNKQNDRKKCVFDGKNNLPTVKFPRLWGVIAAGGEWRL